MASAAARLHVTSPAVSNALHRLRGILGDPLFVRSGRGLTATPKAIELRPILVRAFAEVERALSHELDPLTCTRTFTLALSDADLVATLPTIAKRFAQALPVGKLRVVTLDTLTSTGGLAGETVDATIGPPLAGDGLHSASLYVEEGVFVARRKHPRIKDGKLTRQRFNAELHVDTHVLLGQPGAGNRLADEALKRAGLHRTIAVTVPSFAAVASVVSSTDLLGGMPRRAAEFYARALPLQILTGLVPLRLEMCLHWHARTHHDAAHVAFRAAIAGDHWRKQAKRP